MAVRPVQSLSACTRVHCTLHFTLEHVFSISFVYDFIVKFEMSYYILQFHVDIFYFILYSPVMAINVAETRDLIFLQCMYV